MVRKKPPDLLDLAATREVVDRLRSDLETARHERMVAQWLSDPREATFRAAHDRLASLPSRPGVSKTVRLAAYDARMRAGHAWHPHRLKVREAIRWIEAIEKELKNYE